MPCGRCRQLLLENGGPELLLLTVLRRAPMDEVLPDAFGPTTWTRRPCTPTTTLDLDDPAFVADPYPFFAEERAAHPVAWHEPRGMWLDVRPRRGQRGAAQPPARPDLARPGAGRRTSSRSTCCTATR